MPIAKQGHVGVYLIANHKDVALVTEVGQAVQRFLRPCLPCRIVGVAQHKYLALLVANGLKVVEVHFVIAFGIAFQWVEHHFAPVG